MNDTLRPTAKALIETVQTRRRRAWRVALIDAGALEALIDRGEPDHERRVAMLATLAAPSVTT